MDVDKARGDDMASGVKGALGALPEIADGDNPALTNSDIAAGRRKLHAVYDRAVLDKQIILSHEDHPFAPPGGAFRAFLECLMAEQPLSGLQSQGVGTERPPVVPLAEDNYFTFLHVD